MGKTLFAFITATAITGAGTSLFKGSDPWDSQPLQHDLLEASVASLACTRDHREVRLNARMSFTLEPQTGAEKLYNRDIGKLEYIPSMDELKAGIARIDGAELEAPHHPLVSEYEEYRWTQALQESAERLIKKNYRMSVTHKDFTLEVGDVAGYGDFCFPRRDL